MKYIIGLGNPGKEYENTRHNAGRLFVEFLQKQWQFPYFEENKKWQALFTKGKHEKLGLITLILPQTFMNKSGSIFSAKGGSAFGGKNLNAKPKDIIVAHDDADILFGAFKISFDKRSAGHKGVESVTRALKTKAFLRMRIGIQRKKRIDAMKLVLQPFTPAEKKVLTTIFKDAEKRIATIS